MESIENVLAKLVRIARQALEIVNTLNTANIRYGRDQVFTVFDDFYGNAADAIYALIGEHTETFEESVTYLVLNTPVLSEERRVQMLMEEYEKNHPEQIGMPKPNLISRDEFRNMARQCGGYMSPEGEWK